MKRIVKGLREMKRLKRACTVVGLSAAMAMASSAQTSLATNFVTIFSFDYGNGAEPIASLYEGIDGNLYGTTLSGGANRNGAPVPKV